MMRGVDRTWSGIGLLLQLIGVFAVFAMFLVTLGDVVGRAVWRPVPGAVEIISFLGGICIALAVPRSSQENCHVIVDMILPRMPRGFRIFMRILTRLLALAFYILIVVGLVRVGMDYFATKEVTLGLHIPYYPLAYSMAGAFAVQAVQFCLDIIRIYRGERE
jgi:TRAP-type C4-dicarboxylate transport system permease small subunit